MIYKTKLKHFYTKSQSKGTFLKVIICRLFQNFQKFEIEIWFLKFWKIIEEKKQDIFKRSQKIWIIWNIRTKLGSAVRLLFPDKLLQQDGMIMEL